MHIMFRRVWSLSYSVMTSTVFHIYGTMVEWCSIYRGQFIGTCLSILGECCQVRRLYLSSVIGIFLQPLQSQCGYHAMLLRSR